MSRWSDTTLIQIMYVACFESLTLQELKFSSCFKEHALENTASITCLDSVTISLFSFENLNKLHNYCKLLLWWCSTAVSLPLSPTHLPFILGPGRSGIIIRLQRTGAMVNTLMKTSFDKSNLTSCHRLDSHRTYVVSSKLLLIKTTHYTSTCCN